MNITIPHDLRELNEDEIRLQTLIEIKKSLKTFDKFSHKGTRGHAAIFAGSHGMMGAAILSVLSANKSGAGKVTAIIPEEYFALIHAQSPESLVEANIKEINYKKFNSIGIGPGLGSTTLNNSIFRNIFSAGIPTILDADALNFFSINKNLLEEIPINTILTPHLLEWERLFGVVKSDKARIEKTIEICLRLKINIVIKGHFSCLVTSEGSFFFNGTGNAGMAKAGSGDVLTGLITGMLAQGYKPRDAALIGMYVHGLAGDLAKEILGEEAMIASDQINCFSEAFLKLHSDILNLL
jgi:NAD(P)H-hydrate epimerase